MDKHAIKYKHQVRKGNVKLTDGLFALAVEDNVAFFKNCDVERMLY